MGAGPAPTAVIRGVVKDGVSGQAVSGATVNSDLGDSTVTDSAGAFTLVVEPDDYVISANATGYFASRGMPVTVLAGETKEVTLGIKRGKNFDQDVNVKLDGLPKGVTAEPAQDRLGVAADAERAVDDACACLGRQQVEDQHQKERRPDRPHEMPVERPQQSRRTLYHKPLEWIDARFKPA